MLRMKQAAILLASTVAALAGCAGTAPQNTPDAALNALVEEYFERQLELSPMNATAIGDTRYDDRLDESTSPGFREKQLGIERAFLDRARRMDIAQLSPAARITFEIFSTEREQALAGQKFHEEYMPLNQMSGLPMDLAVYGSGSGPQPFKTANDYQRFLARMRQFPRWVDGAIAQMRTGMSLGITLPKPAVAKVVPQLRGIVTATPQESIFWGPVKDLPADIPAAERQRISQAYATALSQEVLPAYARLADFFERDYLPAARTTVGWSDLPDGAAWYRWRIRGATTMDLPPEQIHELGLKEVARIRAEMLAVKEQVGFKGDLDAFFKHLEDDPQFYFDNEQELLDAYRDVKRRIDALLPKLFSDFPKADYEIRPVEAFRAASAAGGSYQAPSADGTRPGIFYINTTTCVRSRASDSKRFPCTRRRPAIISRLPSSRSSPTCRDSGVSTTTSRTRKAGRCMPSRSARNWACSPTPTSGTAGSRMKCCAPCGWWSTPACTPRAGRASSRSSTCSTTRRWPRAT